MFDQTESGGTGRRVLLVGQSPLTIAGLRAILREGGDEVIGAGHSLGQVADLLGEADAVLLLNQADLALLDAAGAPDRPAALVISGQWPASAPAARPWGLLPPDAAPAEISAALGALQAGLCAVPPALLHQLGRPLGLGLPPGEPPGDEPLTGREREVLQLLAEGLANRQIALRLDISEHTVKFHISSIYAKLGVASRTEAVRAGTRSGLVVW